MNAPTPITAPEVCGLDLGKLEETARAAAVHAPGVWESDRVESEGGRGKFNAYHVLCDAPNPYAKRPWSAIVDTHNSEIICEHEDEDSRWDEPGRVVTEHIAAFGPPTALRLISDLRAANTALLHEQLRASVLLGMAKACRSKFEEYAVLHHRKGTPEGAEKAAANQTMATLCDDAIRQVERS